MGPCRESILDAVQRGVLLESFNPIAAVDRGTGWKPGRGVGDRGGTRLVVFLPPSNPENVAYLRSFIRSRYRLEDAESHEIDRYGNAKYFVNNLVGIFERGQLIGAWGTQRDVTGTKQPGAQEYRSRVHSTKSSSQ